VVKVENANGPALKIVPREQPNEMDLGATRRRTEMIETHCVLFRRSAYERIGGMDGNLSTSRSEVDLSLALYVAGAVIAFEPASQITFMPPPPVEADDREFYVGRWDREHGIRDQEVIERRYNVVDFPPSIRFCEYRLSLAVDADSEEQVTRFHEFHARTRLASIDIGASIPPQSAFLLVDDGQWNARAVSKGRKPLPFLERDGQHWGSPPDDATAISELERMCGMGAEYIVFGFPSFWWLEFYTGLRNHLRSNCRTVLENDRVVVFDIRPKGGVKREHASA
jgi:hypothetical protein